MDATKVFIVQVFGFGRTGLLLRCLAEVTIFGEPYQLLHTYIYICIHPLWQFSLRSLTLYTPYIPTYPIYPCYARIMVTEFEFLNSNQV